MELVTQLLQGNRRALARLISLVENDDPQKNAALQELYTHTGKAFVIGVTGAPGSGKSSLVDRLLHEARRERLTVGVIAVDPTSPFTGGAILGDRIRMQDHALDEGVFIRSMGTRGSLGGLSRATGETIQVLDAFGADLIFIETVGVGQSEVDIVKAADTTVVILTPTGGDSVQTIKAGIMEIADIFAINKADLPGAERTATEVAMMLDMREEEARRPPVVKTSSLNGEGVKELWQGILEHRRFLELSNRLQEVRRNRACTELTEQVLCLVKKQVWEQVCAATALREAVERILQRREDPYTAARSILRQIGFPLEGER